MLPNKNNGKMQYKNKSNKFASTNPMNPKGSQQGIQGVLNIRDTANKNLSDFIQKRSKADIAVKPRGLPGMM